MTKAGTSRLLLDTHVWIWLMNGDQALTPMAASAIEQAANKGDVVIAAISVWEVAMLEAKGRIRLGIKCLEWIERALAVPGVRLAPLSPEIAVESTRLPGAFHGDPVDRMLVATARILQVSLLTHDRRILEYARTGFVQARDTADYVN